MSEHDQWAPLIRQETGHLDYWDTDALLAAIGLRSEPVGIPRKGARPEVAKPSNRTGTGRGES